jgi:hypothetical protein
LPDDPGHLVAIEFDDGVGHLDFCHDRSGLFEKQRVSGRMGEWCRRYSTRKRGLEGEWQGRSGWFSGQSEPYQRIPNRRSSQLRVLPGRVDV